MGFKILLIATKGSSKQDDFKNLGVESSNEFSEWEDHGVASTVLKSGFRLFYIMDKIDPDPSVFEKVSSNGEMIALYIYENMFVSYSTLWEKKKMTWSILHNFQESPRHLDIQGNPPEIIEKLKIEKNEAQDHEKDVDHIFDIPGDIFSSITGYVYNRRYEFDEDKPWEVLKRK